MRLTVAVPIAGRGIVRGLLRCRDPPRACRRRQVYAYTSSAVRIAILKLFVRLEVLLPNLVVGSITRESITGALAAGITARQIVTYLRQHVSPFVADRVPTIPEVRPPPPPPPPLCRYHREPTTLAPAQEGHWHEGTAFLKVGCG